MDYREKIKKIFLYLLSLKNLNEKIIRNVSEYEKLYWENDLLSMEGCCVNKDSKREWWLEVNKKCKSLYDQFFKLYLEIQKRSEDIEIVWGHAIIAWKINDERIIHPLLITRLKLSFDAKKGVFYLIPSNRTYLETGIFEGLEISNFHSIVQIEKEISGMDIDPRNIMNIENILMEILTYVHPNGKIKNVRLAIEKLKISNNPFIYDNPVILVRKNNMRLWQKEIISIISNIDNGYPIPATIKALVSDKKIEEDENEVQQWRNIGKDILFPLDANYEQKQVVKRLSENYGVVVQGPPGTGKSHTIVNLICHLLAHGKRVLITSQTDKALKVLVNMIPEHIKPLCMSILGNDSNSLKQLNKSVRKITDKLSEDPEKIKFNIKSLKLELENCKRNQKTLYNKLIEIQRTENDSIRYKGKQYKIIDIAKWVRENRKQYSWMEDEIKCDQPIPLNKEEYLELVQLLRNVNREDKSKFDSIKNIMDKLPSENEICGDIYKYKLLNENHVDYEKLLINWRIPDNNRCDYDALLEILCECKNEMKSIESSNFKNILELYYNSKIAHDSFMNLVFKCNNYFLTLGKTKTKLKNYIVDMPQNIDINKVNKDFDIVYNKFNSKGTISKIFKLIHPEYNYIFKDYKVNSVEVNTIEQADIVKLYINQNKIMRNIKNLWDTMTREYGIKSRPCNNESEIIAIEQNVKILNTIIDWNMKYRNRIISLLGRISLPQNINWYKSETYSYLIECVQAIKKLDEYNELKAYIKVFKKLILSTGKLDDLYNSIESLDIEKIKSELRKIEHFKAARNDLMKLDGLISKMESGCPNTADNIIQNWGGNIKDFQEFSNAWKWTQWNRLLKDIYKLNIEFIEEAIEEQKRREKVILKDIVSEKTWYNQIIKTSEAEKRSLFAWMQAVKRIGKGTGKMASQYRTIAQNEMENSKEIIPVWIMPTNKIIENIKLSKNLFDVIIFDESSQSDIFSLCALMRAKKAVIVGDDKQISPETVGVDQNMVQGLISKYLKDIPQNEWFDLQTSLYDTAVRVFPNRLMLKEHFRSVPEIIGFSNNLCYFNEIKPLRYPKLEEDIYPPIITIKAERGCRHQSKAINIPEAELLVGKLLECCKDEKYKDMSMGVISLLGEAQSDLIENMIREKIGEEEIIKRRIICGDAYSFQGDERDVMFLSMVIGNNVKFAPLTKESDIRRFNVAASRARNQMWLFYSVDLEELNKTCVRYSLLNYCLNYEKDSQIYKENEYVFQSKMQKDLYDMIKCRGYLAIPNIKVAGYRIDFLMEGSRHRLAIICDNNVKNNELSIEERIELQLNLKKIGWSFFRIRGSEFYYNPEKVIEKLCNKLNRIGIKKYEGKNVDKGSLKVV